MLRTLMLLIGISVVSLVVDTERAQARKWSPGNPGIYGNIHGITYRSMKYERDRGSRRTTFRRSRGGFFRRR
jgi:hypothetical protein